MRARIGGSVTRPWRARNTIWSTSPDCAGNDRCSRSWACCDSVPLSENWLAARVPTPESLPAPRRARPARRSARGRGAGRTSARHAARARVQGPSDSELAWSCCTRLMVSAGRGPVVVPEATFRVLLPSYSPSGPSSQRCSGCASRTPRGSRAWRARAPTHGSAGMTRTGAPPSTRRRRRSQRSQGGLDRGRQSRRVSADGCSGTGACPGRNRKNDGVDDT